MEIKISKLENYMVKDKNSEKFNKRCRFFYLYNDFLFRSFDIEGNYSIKEASNIVKNEVCDLLVKMALKEAINLLDLSPEKYKFDDNKDFRDLIFNKETLNSNSKLNKAYNEFLFDNWHDDFGWYYFRCYNAKNTLIHDSKDKKTLYNHYFDDLYEFNNKTSFLEYYDSNTLDWELVDANYTINHNFSECGRIHPIIDKYGDFYLIDKNIDMISLNKFLRKNDLVSLSGAKCNSNIYKWGAFGYYYGMNNGLSDIESKSFATTLSELLTGGNFQSWCNIKWNTGSYFKEDLIIELIGGIKNNLDGKSLEDDARTIFYSLFDLYKNKITEFEFKRKRLEFRVSQREYDKFMAVKGKSKADKLYYLMQSAYEKIDYSKLPDIDFNKKAISAWLKSNEEKNNNLAYNNSLLEMEFNFEMHYSLFNKLNSSDDNIISISSDPGYECSYLRKDIEEFFENWVDIICVPDEFFKKTENLSLDDYLNVLKQLNIDLDLDYNIPSIIQSHSFNALKILLWLKKSNEDNQIIGKEFIDKTKKSLLEKFALKSNDSEIILSILWGKISDIVSSRIDEKIEILKSLKNNSKTKTEIFNDTNITKDFFKMMIDNLIDISLVTAEPNDKNEIIYKLTENGEKILEIIN